MKQKSQTIDLSEISNTLFLSEPAIANYIINETEYEILGSIVSFPADLSKEDLLNELRANVDGMPLKKTSASDYSTLPIVFIILASITAIGSVIIATNSNLGSMRYIWFVGGLMNAAFYIAIAQVLHYLRIIAEKPSS